jgi:hypothetical protein
MRRVIAKPVIRDAFTKHMKPGYLFGVGLAVVALTCVTASQASAQTDSVWVAVGEEYRWGPLPGSFLGTTYRDLWGSTIRLPVLDLKNFAGGLTPLRRGGGNQTRSVRFQGADGHVYAFRSVNKWPALAYHPDLEGSFLARMIQDQVSSLVPGAPIFAAQLGGAVGIPHSVARMFVMPDDPNLGEFRQEFAGMVGTLEEFVDQVDEGQQPFANYTLIAETDAVLDTMRHDSRERVDTRAYLTARLFDLLIGDWDRHAGQWRWARQDRHGVGFWVPIARDRDYAMVDYDGLLLRFVRRIVPNTVGFTETYSDLDGLLMNARELDRRLLSELPKSVWDSTALALQAQIDDAAIDAALHALPGEFVVARGPEWIRILQSRRNQLPSVANGFFARIAEVPTIHATNEEESAEITRFGDGRVLVEVRNAEQNPGAVYYSRIFAPGETVEIRLFLEDGDDRAVVRGEAEEGIVVHIVGGDGDDVLADSSRVSHRGRWTYLHEADNNDEVTGGPQTFIDRRDYTEPDPVLRGLIRVPPKDFATAMSLRPTLGYSSTRGPIIGINWRRTERGFRWEPYHSRLGLTLRYAPRWTAFGLKADGDFYTLNPQVHITGEGLASAIETMRFYGFGNETTQSGRSSNYLVRRRMLSMEGLALHDFSQLVTLGAGAVARYSEYSAAASTPFGRLRPNHPEKVGRVGVQGALQVHDAEPEMDPGQKRLGIEITSAYFPLASTDAGAFGNLEAVAHAAVAVTDSARTRLNFRLGGKTVWGDYPVDEAAFLGGGESVRGFPEWRFAGDSMLFGSAEGITRLLRLPILMNWAVEAIVFGDVGRVFLSGEDSSKWHFTPGVGLGFRALDAAFTVRYAQGDKGRLTVDLGAP